MNRLLVLGCGLLSAGAASGQSPWVQYPPAGEVRQASDVTQPLPAVVAAAPTAPPVHAHCSPTAGGNCPTCGTNSRPRLQRFLDWLTFQPGPRCLPLFVPNPYQAPLRCYYPPCRQPTTGCGAAGCGPTGCATVGARAKLLSRGGCATCPAPRVGILSRLWHVFDPRPYPYEPGMWDGHGAPCGPGVPSVGGYRFASPTGMPAAPSYNQMSASRPFTAPQ